MIPGEAIVVSYIFVLLYFWPLVGVPLYTFLIWQTLRRPILFTFLAIIITYPITIAVTGCWAFAVSWDLGEIFSQILITLVLPLDIAACMFTVHLLSREFRCGGTS